MKTLRHVCVLIPFVTVLAAAVAEAPRPSLEDFLVTISTRPHAALGMSPGELTAMLGDPSARLEPNVWVYFDFRPVDVPNPENYDALVVVFTENRVSLLRFCSSVPVREFIERQKNGNTPA